MDSSRPHWTSGSGEPFVPQESRIVLGEAGDVAALLHQLARLAQGLLDGTAGDAEREAARRLVDQVLRPEASPAPEQPGDRRPS